jgi:hypothetical protein
MLHQILGGTKIEPRIDYGKDELGGEQRDSGVLTFVYDALEACNSTLA